MAKLLPGIKRCTGCKEIKPRTCFYLRSVKGKRVAALCIECSRAKSSEWKAANRNADRTHVRAALIKSKYGISLQDYDAMIAIQNGKCAICGEAESIRSKLKKDDTPVRLSIDHDHETGEVRGLLCRRCNAGIGCFRDDPKIIRSALLYLGE